jgi:hypothetical protein
MKKEKKLNLPSIIIEPRPPSLRTIDEINEWIEHDYELFFDRAIYEKEKRRLSVNAIFSLL